MSACLEEALSRLDQLLPRHSASMSLSDLRGTHRFGLLQTDAICARASCGLGMGPSVKQPLSLMLALGLWKEKRRVDEARPGSIDFETTSVAERCIEENKEQSSNSLFDSTLEFSWDGAGRHGSNCKDPQRGQMSDVSTKPRARKQRRQKPVPPIKAIHP